MAVSWYLVKGEESKWQKNGPVIFGRTLRKATILSNGHVWSPTLKMLSTVPLTIWSVLEYVMVMFIAPCALSTFTSLLWRTLDDELGWITNSLTLSKPWKANENAAANKDDSKSLRQMHSNTWNILVNILFVIGNLLSAVCLARFKPCNSLMTKNSDVGSWNLCNLQW